MQTFLPYPDFAASARVLDRARLGKQRVEAKQILLALTTTGYGWQNHPVVAMWRGREVALARYGAAICSEWIARGYRDSLLPYFGAFARRRRTKLPQWMGDARVHASHRANLLRKDPEHYGKFGWREAPAEGYFWPVP